MALGAVLRGAEPAGTEALPPGIAPLPVMPKASRPLSPADVSFDRLASTDLPTLKKILEDAGWPTADIVALVSAEAERRLNPIFVLKDQDLHPFVFWHTGPDALPMADLETPEYQAEMARRERTCAETVSRLFPPDKESSSPLTRWDDAARWGTLATGKRDAVRRIVAESRAAIQAAANLPTGQDWSRMWQLHRKARTDIEQLLTKDELFDYDLRNSTTAETMRIELDNFQPTREEFLTLFALRHPIENEFPEQPDEVDAAMAKRKKDAIDAVEHRIEAALGDRRYEEYRISRDPVCMDLQFYARHARNVEAARVRELFFAVRTAQTLLATLAEKSATERQQQETRVQLQEKMQAVLGEKLARRYLEEHNLAPRPLGPIANEKE